MTDDSGGNVAKKGAIGDADPLVILVPVTESPAPPPCGTAGAISCADLDSFGRCDVDDPKSRNETCNGRGDCVNDQCACDLPYLGFNCSEAIGCSYWDPNLTPNPNPKPYPNPNLNPTPDPNPAPNQVQLLGR